MKMRIGQKRYWPQAKDGLTLKQLESQFGIQSIDGEQLQKRFARYLKPVTKAHLVDQIADSTELNKQDCEKIVHSLFAAITKALQAGERIEIRGFGTFKVKDKAARQARNPRTGETISVPAKKVAAFKPSNEIGEVLNPATALPTAVAE